MKSWLLSHWKIVVLALLVTIGIGFLVTRQQEQKTAATISTYKVIPKNFAKTLSSSGKVQAETSVDLKFQTSGKLAWVGVKVGDSVSRYQTLATMDSREVQKSLEKTLRDYASQRNDFEQTKQVTYNNQSASDVFNDTARRILQKNQWDLEQAVLDVELKHLALEYAALTTPIAGIVTHIDTPVAGVNITPATAVFSVADPKSLVFEANVDESDVGDIVVGQRATIALDAFPQATFSGTISYISYVSEQSSGGATVFPVKITFDQPQNLRIGLNGDITIETARSENVLTIPTEAVREDDSGTYVYKKEGDNYAKTPITTGAKNEDVVIVTSGIQAGDIVVTRGFTSISK